MIDLIWPPLGIIGPMECTDGREEGAKSGSSNREDGPRDVAQRFVVAEGHHFPTTARTSSPGGLCR